MTNITKLKKLYRSRFHSSFLIGWICHTSSRRKVSLVVVLLIIYTSLATFTSVFQVSYGRKFAKAYKGVRDDVMTRWILQRKQNKDSKNLTSLENIADEQLLNDQNLYNDHENYEETFLQETSNAMVLDMNANHLNNDAAKNRTHFDTNNMQTNLNLENKRNRQIVSNQNIAIERMKLKLHRSSLTGFDQNEELSINKQKQTDLNEQAEKEVLLQKIKIELKDLERISQFHFPVPLFEPQTKGVIILTNYRSGSTFLGELFNQHSDAFYIFEPLIPFSGRCKDFLQEKTQLLKRLLKCDFPSTVDTFSQVNVKLAGNKIDMKCLRDNFCFRTKTKELCHRSLCYMPTNLCRKCGPVPLTQAMNVCRKKKHNSYAILFNALEEFSVIKVIRFCNILDLKSIMEDSALDVKVIHLVRDPRGIESSRLKLHPDWSIYTDAKITCDKQLHNSLIGRNNLYQNNWLKNRHMEVRYEDLSLSPFKVAKAVLNFVGLEFSAEIQKWIDLNTHNLHPNYKPINPYSTKRNSTSAMQAWRGHLSFSQVQNIQDVCKEAMKRFGYRAVTSEAELNNTNVLLLNPPQ